jgi:acyl-CoA reductase-like NAD-dependent aldehyde dehydrogenase
MAIALEHPTGILLGDGWEQPNDDLEVVSPYTGGVVARVALANEGDVGRAVAAASRHLPPPAPAKRAAVLERAARRVASEVERLAVIIATEAGKPIAQARIEATRCADTLTFAAVEARRLAGHVVPLQASESGTGKLAFTLVEPIGVVAAIAPFNFPLNLVAHKVAPAIAAGCPVVLKPAEATPLSALALAEILLEAGLDPGALTVLNGPGSSIGAALAGHPDVAMISFTGSAAVGWELAARHPRKRVALELGNATPVIVTADADIERAADRIAGSGFTHAGQSCVSVQRVIADRSIHDRLLAAVVTRVERLTLGDPLDEATDVGPLINTDARDRVVAWIDEAVTGGAAVATGGEVRDGLLAPTVLTGVRPDMRAFRDEVFGPLVGFTAYDTVDEAIDLANDTPYGLQAGIFTGRVDRALGWASRLRFGGVLVNETPTFRADQMPYGGTKESGNTREGPAAAIRSMTEQKLVVVQVPTGD